MTRDEAIALIISLEGGYVHDAADPGGESKFGISKRAHPDLDIAALTPEAAAAIYRNEYWNPYAGRVAAVAPALAVLLFDSAVNQGPKAAVEMLQGLVGTLQDGKIGPMTLAALESAVDAHGEGDVMARYAATRALRYVNTRGWDRFGKGWFNRLMTVLMRASATQVTHGISFPELRDLMSRAIDLLEAA
jgi:lysozyme family protein